MQPIKLPLAMLLFCALTGSMAAQTTSPVAPLNQSGFRFSLRGGYDFPRFHNNTPYIDYKGGLEAGASADHYWNWFGLGADFDFIKNRPKSTYPTQSLSYLGNPVTSFALTERRITRIFYGLGPDFKYQKRNRFSAEVNLRGGLANIKGGRTLLTGATATSGPVDLNFHAGYRHKYVLSAKGQLRLNYLLNDFVGLHVGGYYLRHFRTRELVDLALGYSTGYRPFTTTTTDGATTNDVDPTVFNQRKEPCDCDISSIGAFAGVTVALPVRAREKEVKKCNTCARYSLTVTARDRFTKELLPNTDVALKNMAGEVAQTGTTNNFGVVTFPAIVPDNYAIEGILYGTSLDRGAAKKEEFRPNEVLQKEILYSDQNFILKGTVVLCNSATPINGVSVILKNASLGEQKNTLTDEHGAFAFNLKQRAEYTIYGKKASYFSQSENIATSDFNRSTTLFIKLEICMEEADCDKAITLNNIYYDFDHAFLRPASEKELDRLVQFMVDNPGVRVEVRSHTDSRGSNAHNADLSQRRANSAVEYLASQGIRLDRLVPRGFGESLLLNECADGVDCSEEKHQINRRTEVKVICPGKN